MAMIASQLFVFVPLLTYDERRIAAGRNFCICCIKHGWYDYHETIQMIEMNKQSRATAHATDTESPRAESDDDSASNEQDWHRFFSMEYVLIHTLVPILSKRVYRIIIYVIFGIVFILSILSFSTLDTETDVTKLIPDDSHIVDFIEVLEGGWGSISFATCDIVIRNRDFSDAQTRSDVWAMVDEIDNNFYSPYADFTTPVSEWMTDFDDWLALTFNDSNITVDDVEDQYYQLLQEFVDDEDYRQWKDQIVFDDDDNPTKIVATKVCRVFCFFTQLLLRMCFLFFVFCYFFI